jgi:imidazolonepropionase
MPLAIALARACLGMTPAECVTAATVNAAATLGLDHAAGTLHAGKRADFVALDLPSYRTLGDVLDGGPAPLVVVKGEPVVANVQELEPGF